MKTTARLLGLTLLATGVVTGSASGQEYPEIELRAASVYESTQIESKALERFAEAVGEKSDGNINIRTYAGTSLGSQEEINELLTTGGIEIAVHGIAPSSRYVGLFLPYVIDGADHLSTVLDSEVGEAWNSELADTTGLEMLRVTFRGDRHTMTRTEVDDVADLEGLRIRAPDIPAIVASIESFGASPVIMSIAEVYTGLATGAIDGLENTLGGMLNYKFNEVAKYVVLTRHGASPVFWLTNKGWFDGLDEATQTLLRDEMRAATEWADEQNAQLVEEWRSELESTGVTFVETDVDAMRANSEEFVEREAIAAWGEEAFDKINEVR